MSQLPHADRHIRRKGEKMTDYEKKALRAAALEAKRNYETALNQVAKRRKSLEDAEAYLSRTKEAWDSLSVHLEPDARADGTTRDWLPG